MLQKVVRIRADECNVVEGAPNALKTIYGSLQRQIKCCLERNTFFVITCSFLLKHFETAIEDLLLSGFDLLYSHLIKV